MRTDLYLGLVHYPVYNKDNEIVTTSITNLDIHDIARSCCTYGVKKYFIIHPLASQQLMLQKILKFWQSDIAKKYNKDRVKALQIVEYASSIQKAVENIQNQELKTPRIITTTAQKRNNQVIIETIRNYENPVLVLFGTGNGLAESVHDLANVILSPISGRGSYNHLSVRSAVAIILDRINSEK